MAKASDPGRFFNKVLDRPTARLADEVLLREHVAVWKYHDEHDHPSLRTAFATSRDIGSSGNTSKACARTNLLDVGGTFFTDQSGRAEFLLSEFWCAEWFPGGYVILKLEYPVILVATPQSNTPVLLTSQQVLVRAEAPVPTANDVKITVFSWAPNGTARGNVLFDWRCSVPFSTPGPWGRTAP